MARKTIEVAKLHGWVHAAMKATGDDMTRERLALAGLLERVLMDTGNYRGFHYVDAEGKPVGWEPEVTDETRRYYY